MAHYKCHLKGCCQKIGDFETLALEKKLMFIFMTKKHFKPISYSKTLKYRNFKHILLRSMNLRLQTY